MATANAIKRAKEVGVRKAIGATKGQIIWQFIFETAIICLVSIIAALAIVEVVLPYYNTFLVKDLAMNGSEFYLQIIIIFWLNHYFCGLLSSLVCC